VAGRFSPLRTKPNYTEDEGKSLSGFLPLPGEARFFWRRKEPFATFLLAFRRVPFCLVSAGSFFPLYARDALPEISSSLSLFFPSRSARNSFGLGCRSGLVRGHPPPSNGIRPAFFLSFRSVALQKEECSLFFGSRPLFFAQEGEEEGFSWTEPGSRPRRTEAISSKPKGTFISPIQGKFCERSLPPTKEIFQKRLTKKVSFPPFDDTAEESSLPAAPWGSLPSSSLVCKYMPWLLQTPENVKSLLLPPTSTSSNCKRPASLVECLFLIYLFEGTPQWT